MRDDQAVSWKISSSEAPLSLRLYHAWKQRQTLDLHTHGQIKAHCWLWGVRGAIILCGRATRSEKKHESFSSKFRVALYCCVRDGEKREKFLESRWEDIWIHERVSINARLWPHPPVYIAPTIILLLYILLDNKRAKEKISRLRAREKRLTRNVR